jgi:MoxR-like ATPase
LFKKNSSFSTRGENGLRKGQARFARDNIIGKIFSLIGASKIVIMSSPPCTGKTSIMALLPEYPAAETVSVKYIYVSFAQNYDPEDVLLSKGVNVRTGEVAAELRNLTHVIFLLDDAQSQLHNTSFWSQIIKANIYLFFQIHSCFYSLA